MNALFVLLLFQAAPRQAPREAPRPAAPPHQVFPILAFPEPGLDDSAAYEGYRTRFFRDSRRNAVQVYVDGRTGRVVQLWADAADESVGFTVRDTAGRPAPLAWGTAGAMVADSGRYRTFEYRLTSSSPELRIGWLALGSMRVERDLQYARRHLEPFDAPPFRQPELDRLVASVERLPAAERRRELALLGARRVEELGARLQPTLTASENPDHSLVRVVQPTLDGRNRLLLEVGTDPTRATVRLDGARIAISARASRPVEITIRTATDADALTPLDRRQIFNQEFFAFQDSVREAHARALRATGDRRPVAADSLTLLRYRRLEREVRSVELLASEEKLMAGLPNYATYFGRDMMMTALMMRPVWLPAMSERVIAAVLRKLSSTGQVSHEEALGGQAIRENAAEYDSLAGEYFRLVKEGDRPRADSALLRARALLRDLQAVRENYHMLDGEFQLPVLVARYLDDPSVPAERKRAFLRERSRGAATHLALLLRELDRVATVTAPYAAAPTARNLVSFVPRDSARWRSASWRDSNAGYANGRFAMDINAIWAPAALEATARILSALRALDLVAVAVAETGAAAPDGPSAGPGLAAYLRDSTALAHAVDVWRGARRHFVVALGPREIRRHVDAKLAWLPADERRYWEKVLSSTRAGRESLRFLALSLDGDGRPIGVVSTDPAIELFLGDVPAAIAAGTLPAPAAVGGVDAFTRPYPVGLFVDRLGPVVANDAFAPRAVWDAFAADGYHGPRVVWGREVNLLLLGLARQLAFASDSATRAASPEVAPYARALDAALRRTLAAVDASGFRHSELWSYRIEHGALLPVRYGISSDLQLWSDADLAVQFVLSRLPHR